MRDRQQEAKLKKWPNVSCKLLVFDTQIILTLAQCTIRIRFHNQMQLEKSFPSTSKIKAVYAFVRECLNDDTKPIKFVLCELDSSRAQSPILTYRGADQPPARELKVSDATVRDKTLIELELAPSSVLLLRFLSSELNGEQSIMQHHGFRTEVPHTQDRETLPPLQPSILGAAEDFPVHTERSEPPTVQPQPGKVQGSQQVNQKLAKFLKLHPHK
jgi:tether containing UBX domain for GLUT4